MQETTVKSKEKRDKIFIIHAISSAYLILLGAAGEKIGLDRTLKANTVKKRVLSLIKAGLHLFQ